MKVIAVMPAFQEAKRIAEAVRGVRPRVDELVVVDDGSSDQTAKEARAAGAFVIRHRVNRGQGAALRTGTQAALNRKADIVVHIDADGQHDPQDIAALLQPIKGQRADVVFGSRFLGIQSDGMPLVRRVVLRGGRVFNAYALGIPKRVTDAQTGSRALNRRAATRLLERTTQDGRAHCSEMLKVLTDPALHWCEVPIHVRYTADTLAKGNQTWHAAEIVWKLFLGKVS